ncbi:MAG: TonB-dependent receptor [Pseudomonadota bacterium]
MTRLFVACLVLLISSTVVAQESAATAPTSNVSTELDELLAPNAGEPVELQAAEPQIEPTATDAEPNNDSQSAAVVEMKTEDAPKASSSYKNSPPAALEEIVVTATKRAESVREIPASITALLGEDLEKMGVQGAEELMKMVPGVNMTQSGDSAARITVRGISAGAGTNSTTGILFGDVSFTDSYLPFLTLDPNPFDLQTFEVLKGPQGTLYGAGALNGAVRYVPMAAKLGVFEFKYFAQYSKVAQGGSDPTYGGAINLPLGEDWALRVVGFDRRSPGYVDDTQTGKKDVNSIDQNGARAMLHGQFDDQLDVRLMFAMQNTHIADTGVTDNRNGNLSHGNRPRPSPQNNRYSIGDLKLDYNLDWANLISETAYVRKTGYQFFDASSRLLPEGQLPLLAQIYNNDSQTLSQELRLVSKDDADARWKWVGGIFGSRQNIQSRLDTPVGDLSLPIAALVPALNALLPGLGDIATSSGDLNLAAIDSDVSVKELALFGEVTRRLGSDWELSLGGRLYRTTSGGKVDQTGILLTAINGSTLYSNKDKVTGQGINPKISLMWHATDDLQLYATASRGFRAGGLQPGFAAPTTGQKAPTTFKADSLWSYELGERSNWLDNTLHFDVAVFLAKWTDPQTLQVVSGSSVPSSYLTNVGGVDSRGVEASLQYALPLPGLTLSASGAYTKTVTTEDFIGFDGSTVPPGTPWAFAPRWQTATTLSYAVEAGEWALGTNVTHLFIGKASNDLVKSANLGVFGYKQWNLQFSVARPSLTWLPELSFAIDNLTDERGVANIYTGGAYTDVTYIRPRSMTLRLSGHF